MGKRHVCTFRHAQRAAYRTAISAAQILVKYADDVDLLVPETSDVDIVTEFNSVKDWATQNKMVINFLKTKEMVFHRPNPRNIVYPPVLDSIERVRVAKLLRAFF